MGGQWKSLLQLALRDGAIAGATLALWHDLPPVLPAAVLAALLTTLVGFGVHEWGHLLGALAARARVELPAMPFQQIFLFRFDRTANSRPQFFAMALGGFAASILTVAVLLAVLPRDTLAGALALGLVGLGVAATLVIEVPEFWRVWRGGPLPDGAAFVSGPKAP